MRMQGVRGGAPAALWMMVGAFCFAVMSALTYGLGSRCDWLLIAALRAGFMFGVSCAMARWWSVRLVLWQPRTLWVRSLAGSFSLVCNFYAMTRLPIADVLTISNTYPLWIIVLSAVLLGLPPTVGEMVGVISGLAGVVLIQQPHRGGDAVAATVALCGSVGSAVAMLGLHRLRGLDARAIVAHFAGVATLVTLGWMALRGFRAITLDAGHADTWLMLAGVAASGTIGQFFLTKAYAAGPPSEVALVGLSQVVFGMGFDVVIYGRSLTPAAACGFALVLLPTAWLSTRAGRRVFAPRSSRARCSLARRPPPPPE